MMVWMETERLIVRDHVATDLEDLFSLLSDPKVMRFLPDLEVHNREGAEVNLRVAMAEAASPMRTKFFFAIVEKATGRYLGEIGFTLLGSESCGKAAEMGYFIHASHWGRGIVTEAGARVLRFAFEEVGLDRMEIGCNTANAGSERIMLKLGFSKVRELRSRAPRPDLPATRVEYCLRRPGEPPFPPLRDA